MNDREAKQKVVDAGIRLVKSGLIARTWGNVSCRISDTHFVISPSGRDYLTLTPEEIVTVALADLSYSGEIKPSSEKGVHAEIYKYSPDCHFIIHTHQENASVISALGLDSIKVDPAFELLGNTVICASYGLPGTKTLRRGIGEALKGTKGHAIIMRNHGAVCFGRDDEEAFQAASDLEKASGLFVEEKYREITDDKTFDADRMRQYVLSKLARVPAGAVDSARPYCISERTADGFILHGCEKRDIAVTLGQLGGNLPDEAKIHNEIYRSNLKIHYIMHADTPDIMTVSRAGITLYPHVDDFAQIIGTKVKTVPADPVSIASALRNTSAVLIKNSGALCCGASESDAGAVQMILQKNCKARISGTLFGGVKPISRFDSQLMRFVYLKKYSKQISANKL